MCIRDSVEGKPLLDFARDKELSLDGRLDLFLKICAAVIFAHRNLVVHRDIKPLNILVNADGEPKLLDFGLAKILTDSGGDMTRTVLRAFTPAYASPEQILGHHITTASDIYSLGVVLYELLTGSRPLDLESLSLEEMVKTIRICEPEPPSSVPITDASGEIPEISDKGLDPRSIAKLEGDIDTIVLKALRKAPEERYESVEQLALDIERYINFEPILARPQTITYRTAKFLRRNLVAVTAGIVVFFTLSAMLGIAVWQARTAVAERDRAHIESEKTNRINAFLNRLMLTANPGWNSPGFGREGEVTLIEVIDEAAERIKTEFADQPDILATLQYNIGIIYIARGRYSAGEDNLRASLEATREMHGDDHADTVQRMRDLAAALLLKGDYEDSLKHYEQALDIYRSRIARDLTEGNTVLGFAGSLNDLGFLHRLRGEPELSEAPLTEALLVAEDFDGNERAVTALVLNHLGMSFDDRGDPDRAESYLRRSLEEFRSLPGGKRAESAGALVNFGIILQGRGILNDAAISSAEAFETYKQLLGDSHPFTAFGLSRIADLHLEKGELNLAVELGSNALERARNSLPEDHPNLAYQLTTLGLGLCRNGRPADGETHLRKALELRVRSMKGGYWRIAETEGALGECLAALGRFEEAKTHLYKSRDDLMRVQPPESSRVRIANERLDSLRSKENR
jgi:tetratricopeptide (TPR) repeat protein